MKEKWNPGDSIPCSQCGKDAIYRIHREKGKGVGFFVCEACGEKHYILSALLKSGLSRKRKSKAAD